MKVLVYGTWSLTLREQRLRVFQNRILRGTSDSEIEKVTRKEIKCRKMK
jgi:predicted nucleotidyltransferase